jgi:hypothetical protein
MSALFARRSVEVSKSELREMQLSRHAHIKESDLFLSLSDLITIHLLSWMQRQG